MFNKLVADAGEMVSEQVQFRELLFQMVRRDLLIRYKQSVMGFGWAVFMPVVNTAIFSVVFMRLTTIDVGAPYPLFAFTGLVAWNFFASSLRFAVISLTSNTTLVSKVYFPREVFVFSSVVVAVVDLLVGFLVLAGMLIYYRVPVTGAWIFLPVVVVVHVLFTCAVALVLAMGNLFYRDVKYLFEVGITAWMFGTTVLYPLDGVGGTLGALLKLNPMTPIIEAYRKIIVFGTLPQLGPFSVAAAIAIFGCLGAWLWFHKSEFKFAESI